MTCRSTSAGAVRLRNHTIETKYADRREAWVHFWKENRTDDVSSEAHGDVADDTAENAKETDVQEYQVGEEEVDVADVSNKESKGLKRRGEQFFKERKVLETPMQSTVTARERKLVRWSGLEAEPAAVNSASREREFSSRVSWVQGTSKAKENLNNLDTKALGREVMSRCASGYVTIPAITLRGVVVAISVRTINANSNEFENGCHLKLAKDTKTGVASTADSVSMSMKKCWSRRSSRENNAGLACGHEQVKRVGSADAAQRRHTVECPRQKIEESARQVDWRVLSAHRWVRLRTFYNRSTPQVTDQGLPGKPR